MKNAQSEGGINDLIKYIHFEILLIIVNSRHNVTMSVCAAVRFSVRSLIYIY